MSVVTLVDSEAACKAWLLADAGVAAAVGTRVFFATPAAYGKGSAPASWITLFLVSETEDVTDVGVQLSLHQLDIWGATKLLASQGALAVQTAARKLRDGAQVTVGQTVIVSGDWMQRRWLPDSTTNTARYSVDVLLTCRGL